MTNQVHNLIKLNHKPPRNILYIHWFRTDYSIKFGINKNLIKITLKITEFSFLIFFYTTSKTEKKMNLKKKISFITHI